MSRTIRTRLMDTLYGMKSRCHKENNPKYNLYGARGITVCDEWLENPDSFIEWSINNGYDYIPDKKGRNTLSIDRINNDGNYDPLNCRWTDRITQQVNQGLKRTEFSHLLPYRNISFRNARNPFYIIEISHKHKKVYSKTSKTLKEAIKLRNKFIVENDLPHPLDNYCISKDHFDELVKQTPRYGKADEDLIDKKIKTYAYDKHGKFVGSYSSMSEAARELSVPQNHISCCTLGKRRHTGGYQFRNKDMGESIDPISATTNTKRTIYVYKDDELVYEADTQKLISEFTGSGQTTIARRIRSGKPTPTGFIVSYDKS